MTTYKTVSAKITQSEKEKLDEMAKKQGITTSVLVRQALGVYLAYVGYSESRLAKEYSRIVKRVFREGVARQLEREFARSFGQNKHRRMKVKTMAEDFVQSVGPYLSFLQPKKRGRPTNG